MSGVVATAPRETRSALACRRHIFPTRPAETAQFRLQHTRAAIVTQGTRALTVKVLSPWHTGSVKPRVAV
jgi:hypothetical protein